MAVLALCFAGIAQVMAADSLKVSVHAANPPGGSFGTSYVAVMWVENAAGAFVKSFGRWGNQTGSNDLPIWNSKNGGVKTIDGVTGATPTAAATLASNWKCTDANGTAVPNGTYKINIELNNHHNTITNCTDWLIQTGVVVDGAAKTKTVIDSSFNSAATYLTAFSANYIPGLSALEAAMPARGILVTSTSFIIPPGFGSQTLTLRIFSISGQMLWREKFDNIPGAGLVIEKSSLQKHANASSMAYLLAEYGTGKFLTPMVTVK
jgi:hypothetical protein